MSPDGWERVAADLLRTTGRRLTVRVRQLRGAKIEFVMFVDGRWCGTVIELSTPTAETVEHDVVECAAHLGELVLDEEVWGGWPICPVHGGHPLDPAVQGGMAMWVCPRGEGIARIGSLDVIAAPFDDGGRADDDGQSASP